MEKRLKNIQTFEQYSSELNISDIIHHNSYLSKSDIDFLELKGFKKDISKNSGYYFIENFIKTIVLIPYKDGSYKLEFFEILYDGDGNCYEDFDKEYSKEGESLEDFINFWIDYLWYITSVHKYFS